MTTAAQAIQKHIDALQRKLALAKTRGQRNLLEREIAAAQLKLAHYLPKVKP